MDLWKQELLQSYSSLGDLAQVGLVTPSEQARLESLGEHYKIRVTPYYAKLMETSVDCPIRKQALPHLNENDPILPEWAEKASLETFGRKVPWIMDSIGDLKNLAAPRITHRYGNRAILHTSSTCAVYCRFCFRKEHLNDDERTLYEGTLDPAFDYLEKTPSIREVILTGGDPLSISDSAFKRLLDRLSQIAHIKTVRIHSRMAVTLPYRFTPTLLEIMAEPRPFQLVLVSHFNHPKELTNEARQSLKKIKKGTSTTLLNQSVLLRGVNTNTECLALLFQSLYEEGVIPFYLHHPDWTPGTFHFRLSIEEGRKIVSQLRGLLSGPALPDYILEIPQGYGKISLLDGRVQKIMDIHPPKSPLQGAIYELPAPATRVQAQGNFRFLDLFYRSD